MRKYSGIPELLERYMEENGADERWVTVRELCEWSSLTRYESTRSRDSCRRLESGPFREFPYIVLRIERIERSSPSDPPKRRYLSLDEDQSRCLFQICETVFSLIRWVEKYDNVDRHRSKARTCDEINLVQMDFITCF